MCKFDVAPCCFRGCKSHVCLLCGRLEHVIMSTSHMLKCLKIKTSFKKKEKKKKKSGTGVQLSPRNGYKAERKCDSPWRQIFLFLCKLFSFYFLNIGNDSNFFYFIIYLSGNFWKNKNKNLIINTFFNFIFVLFMYNFLNLI